MENSFIAAFLKSKRKDLELSVNEVIERLHVAGIDISPKTLYSWESGHRQPDADTFTVILQIYDVQSIKEILHFADSYESELIKTTEEALVENFHKLNEEGQEKLLDYADDLVSSGKYKKTGSTNMAKEA